MQHKPWLCLLGKTGELSAAILLCVAQVKPTPPGTPLAVASLNATPANSICKASTHAVAIATKALLRVACRVVCRINVEFPIGVRRRYASSARSSRSRTDVATRERAMRHEVRNEGVEAI